MYREHGLDRAATSPEAAVPGVLPSAADLARRPFVDYSGMALPPGARSMPRWLRAEGLCFVGCWETLPWRRYSGIATTWAEKDYAFEHSQAFVEHILQLGCNAVVVPYDCGHGEAFIEGDVGLTKTFIELAHRHGLRVGTYVRADIVWTETLSDAERAELEGGFQIDARGRFVQPFGSAARNLCHHHPGVLARFRRHLRRAILDLGTDMLHLDGMIVGGAEGDGACRCPTCVADFRHFLVARYGQDRELATQRFGHPYLERMEPPAEYPLDAASYDSGPIRPHWCEWVAFRCQWTSRILAEVAALTRELNPEVVIEINNALPAVRENAALYLGTDLGGVGHYTDASWSEDGYPPALLPDGKLIQRIRQFKLCRAAGTVALTYMDQVEARALRQNLAHTAAFNLGTIGCIGFPPHMNFSNRYNVHFQVKAEFMRWLNSQREAYRDTCSAARTAVWRPRESLALSGRLAYAASMRMEQLLIETCRGFDLVLGESPAALARYDLVIVPNVECMSLAQIGGLLEYVANGGSLFVGQDCAMYDLWHRRRIENPWAALFGDASARNVVADAVASGVAGAFSAPQATDTGEGICLVEHGKGRAVYAPWVVDPAAQPSLTTSQGGLNTGLDHTNWVVPAAAEEFARALDWLLRDRESCRVTAPRGVLAEFLHQEGSKRTLVHLVNLGPEPQSRCTVAWTSGRSPAAISVLSPPTDVAPRWRVARHGQRTEVVFELLDVYAVVVAAEG